MTINNNVLVNVLVESPPVAGAVFGVPALAANAGSLGVGFTERVRFYETAGAVAADLTAGDIDAAVAGALTTGFSQSPRVSKMAVIRLDAAASPMQLTWTIGGGAAAGGEVSTITIDGIEGSYTSIAAGTAADVAAGLRADLTTVLAALAVTVSGAGVTVVVTGDTVDDVFSYSSSVLAPFTVATAVDESGLEIASSLADAVALPASAGWYAFTLQSRADIHQLEAAIWVEANERLFLAQSSSPDILTASVSDLASVLAALNYQRTGVMYYGVDASFAAFAWLCTTLQADPDAVTTIWAYKTLEGVAAEAFSSTQRANLDVKNANYYPSFFGQGATWSGVTADGQKIDIRVTLDWVTARSREALASLLLRVSNLNRKIPYTDEGISQVSAVVRAVLIQGENAGHFTPGSSTVSQPLAANVSPVDKAARLLRLEFVAELAGAIELVTVSGFVTFQLSA